MVIVLMLYIKNPLFQESRRLRGLLEHCGDLDLVLGVSRSQIHIPTDAQFDDFGRQVRNVPLSRHPGPTHCRD